MLILSHKFWYIFSILHCMLTHQQQNFPRKHSKTVSLKSKVHLWVNGVIMAEWACLAPTTVSHLSCTPSCDPKLLISPMLCASHLMKIITIKESSSVLSIKNRLIEQDYTLKLKKKNIWSLHCAHYHSYLYCCSV